MAATTTTASARESSKSNCAKHRTTHNTPTHFTHHGMNEKKIPEINSKQEFYLYIN